LGQLQKQAEIAEQTAAHKNAEVQAAQEKLNKLQASFDADTARLTAVQAEKLRTIHQDIENTIQRRHTVCEALQQSINEATAELDTLETEIEAMKTTITAVRADLRTTKAALKATEQQLAEVQGAVAIAINEKSRLELEVSALETAKLQLIEDSASLDGQITGRKGELDTIEAEYAAKVADKEAAITLLDAKLLDRGNDIERLNHQEETLRQDLVAWQRRLEEQDKNLRIREAKVNIGEDKIVQNSQLMNL
jgi:chromosome segregation ATPase